MNGKTVRRISMVIYIVLLAAALLALLWFSARYRPAPGSFGPVQKLDGITCKTGTETNSIALPAKLKNLPPRTPVTLYAQVNAKPRESLLIKTVFAPLEVYVDDELIFRCGQDGSYPSYMNDPPTIIATVPLPYKEGALSLRMNYLSPAQRDEISLPAVYMGSDEALLAKMLYENGFSLLFSLFFILMGIVMIFAWFAFVLKIPSGSSFLWLGLFSISTGIWVFGECDLTALLLPYYSLLHVMTYIGLFLICIPLLHFGLVILNPKNKLPIKIMLHVHYISAAAAVLLQLSGIMDFTKSLYWFHFIVPLAFTVFAACLLWEHFVHRNEAARRFAVPVAILAASTVLELLNYRLRVTYTFTLFFQLGSAAFIISLGFISGHYVKRSFQALAEKTRLEYEVASMERQLDMQRQQYVKMAEYNEVVKAQRHDLRHHVAVIKKYGSSGDMPGLKTYLDKLSADIPSDRGIRLCENFAVNAVASHYFSVAKDEGIDISVNLAIPAENGCVQDSDLCIIVGNLLENAIEACRRMTFGRRFVIMNTRLHYDTLTITMDNSFDGNLSKNGGVFFSSKREGKGTGLSSVSAVAGKYGGTARFEAKGDVFLSSVYVKLQ